MNIAEIESQLKDLVEQRFDPATFVYRLLEIYDAPKATVTKLRQGSANHAAKSRDLLRENSQYDTLWKNKLFFRVSAPGQAATTVDAMAADPLTKKHNPRFLLASDGAEAYCLDTRLDQSLDTTFDKLNDGFMFLLPLAGVERYEAVTENPADIKATWRLAKLYDAILAANPGWASHDHTHELNLLMTRLLFCFFAERTSIFATGLFTSTVLTLTRDDGSDTASALQTLFAAMNTPSDGRAALPDYARKFPYVNGGLFAVQTSIPTFGKGPRRLLKECGDLSWHEINPDIFGSMIQAVVEPDLRGDMGMHYTSVPNIMRVLHPLFLLSLEDDLAAAWDSEAKLRKLLDRLYRIHVFDPACGSGNFLIIAYRELRKLENKIFARLNEVAREPKLPMTGIKLNHFFGIELADFACETAKLSMWIAEYQMNEQFKATFGVAPPALPLRDSGNIIHGNSTRLDWLSVCPRGEGLEIYVVGNPPYLGARNQSAEHKSDMEYVFEGGEEYKDCDYVACWLLKGAAYISKSDASFAFVTTNGSAAQVQYLKGPNSFALPSRLHALRTHPDNAGNQASAAHGAL
ncbi:MAG: DNA methyltransferase, partial [Aliidongia sp.]